MAARIRSLRNGLNPVDELSRDDLVATDIVTVSSLDGATTYDWELVFVPEGSAATFSGVPTAVSPGSFTVDLEGPYLVRLVVDAGLGSEDTQYVRLRALTAFGDLTLVAAGERRDGTGIIPVDVDAEGWANEQNANLQTLKGFIKPLATSGRLLYVDANDGTDNYADYSSIQAAITAASTAGASSAEQWIIAVRPGTYVETVTFESWIHVVGWPGNQVSEPEMVVLEGIHTAAIPLGVQRTLISNIQIENNADSTSATLTKSGNGTLLLHQVRLESNGSDALQGAALELTDGGVEAQNCTFIHNDAGVLSRVAFAQNGGTTESQFEECEFSGPSGLDLNPSPFNVGVTAVLDRCKVTAEVAGGTGIITVANRTEVHHSTVVTQGGDAIYVNPTAAAFVGAVALSVTFSDLQDDISFDVTGIGGVTTLNLGSVKYPALVFPGGAVTNQTALTQAKSLFFDDTIASLGVADVQAAIEAVASGKGTPFVIKAVPELPNNTFRFEGWAPVAGVVTDISVRMATVNTNGNYTVIFTNETTGNTMLVAASFDMNTLVSGDVTSLSLTGTPSDLVFAAGDEWSAVFTSDDLTFDGSGIYFSILWGVAAAIVITGAPDDSFQTAVEISPSNTVNNFWFAPYNCEIVAIKAYTQVAPVTAGVYTLAVEDIDNANNLLVAATFDLTGLVSATLTPLSLTATPADLLLAAGTRVRLQFDSDNADLTAEGLYYQIIYRSQ